MEALNNRELKVLRLLAQGKSSYAIAEIMFLSRSTITKIMQDMYRKLGTNNMQQAISIGWVRGILKEGDEVGD